MKLDNIINHWDPRQRDRKGRMFILFAIYVFPTYITLDLFNFRINFAREE